jgi:hypothetical protein
MVSGQTQGARLQHEKAISLNLAASGCSKKEQLKMKP